MSDRVYNFNPGPATLPLDVLRQAQKELLDYHSTGMSVMEISHRSPEFDEISLSAAALIKEILGLTEQFHVLFLGGGASTQFALTPLNFLSPKKTAAYVDTGTWSAKAIKEARGIGNVQVVFSSKEEGYRKVPTPGEIDCPPDAAYLHLTSNNTIVGTQFHQFPDPQGVPLVCDMSSDIASRRLDYNRFSLIYAGAQKNLGPAGVTIVIIRDDLLARCAENLPSMFNYQTHAKKNSMFNTPPAFSIYMVRLVLDWIKKQGGLAAVEKSNIAKKDCLYAMMDGDPDFFRGTVEPDSRSWMNITMRLPSEKLEQKLISDAKVAGFVGLKGHRSVGGVRVSMYNAMPLEGIEKLVAFMKAFRKAN